MTKTDTVRHSKINVEGDLETRKAPRESKSSDWNIPPEYFNLGFYLTVPLILAVFVGPKLDKYFKTDNFFTLALITFGTISVFYNLYKLYKKG